MSKPIITPAGRFTVLKIGGPAFGKGFFRDRLKKVRQDSFHLHGGEITTEQLTECEQFRSKHGETVRSGLYVPDVDMIPLIHRRMTLAVRENADFIEADGVGRTVAQMQRCLIDRGFLAKERALCVQLLTSRKVARRRFEEAQERRRAQGRTDTDVSVFDTRYDIYEEHLPEVLDLIGHHEVRIIQIDTEDGGLEVAARHYIELVEELVPRLRT